MIIEKEGKEFLAVSTGLKSKAFIGSDVVKMKSAPGFIVNKNGAVPWRIEGFTEIDGFMYFYGPKQEGRLLKDIDLDENIVSELLSSFMLLSQTNYNPAQFSLKSVYIIDGGGLLFFPPRLMDFINSRGAETDNLINIYPWNYPGLDGESAQAFTIAAFIYKIATGKSAFSGDNRVALEQSILKKNYASPAVEKPLIRREIKAMIDSSFSGKGSLEEWQTMLAGMIESGWNIDGLSSHEKVVLKDETLKTEEKRLRKIRFGKFVEKNRTKLIAAAVSMVILFMIIRVPLSAAFEPPLTSGMSQTDVIELYYKSYNNLDYETMEGCIIKKVGKSDINQVVTLTAVISTRKAYEAASPLIDAEDWLKSGSPSLAPGSILWGLSSLKIEKLPLTDTFLATYERWGEGVSDDKGQFAGSVYVRDIIHLGIKKDAWVIDRIERTIAGESED